MFSRQPARLISAAWAAMLLACAVAIGGCSSTDDSSLDTADSGPPSDPDGSVSPDVYEGLGDLCGLGCVGSETCASQTDSCDTGTCTFDGEDAYCTIDCAVTPCPEGYACSDTIGYEGAPERVCWHTDEPDTDTGTVELDLALTIEIDGADVVLDVDDTLEVTEPTASPPTCGFAYHLGSTPYPSFSRQWERLLPCVDPDPRLRDTALLVYMPIPEGSASEPIPGMDWSLRGSFASSASDQNNFWAYEEAITVTVTSVERSGGMVRVAASVSFEAPLWTCVAPEDGECDVLGAQASVAGDVVWEIPDPYAARAP